MGHVLFDLAADKPLLDFTGYTAARTVTWPDSAGRAILSNAITASISDVSAGGSIGSAATTVDISQSAFVNQSTAYKVLTLATPTSGLAMFYTVANVGSAGFHMYGRFVRPGGAHTFIYVPSVGWRRTSGSPQVIEQNWVGATAPANDTNENTLFTTTIPGGVMGANGVLMIRTKLDCTSSANTKTFRARLGGTLLCTVSAASNVAAVGIVWDICNRNSESSQIGTNGTGGAYYATGTTSTASIDTSADATLTITAQKATGTETVTFHGVSITLQRFD